MEFNNEPANKEVLDRLERHGILLSKNAPDLSKEQALVLLGQAMLEKFIKGFVALWKCELFPNCLIRDFEATNKEKQQILSKQRLAGNIDMSAQKKDTKAEIKNWGIRAELYMGFKNKISKAYKQVLPKFVRSYHMPEYRFNKTSLLRPYYKSLKIGKLLKNFNLKAKKLNIYPSSHNYNQNKPERSLGRSLESYFK